MRVVRVHGGTVYHLVHETKTGSRKATAFILCKPGIEDVNEMRAGVPTCKTCLDLDNPMNLTAHEYQCIRVMAMGHPMSIGKPASIARLQQLDILDDGKQLTHRGKVLAEDFISGTAPWFDEVGISHYRVPLGSETKCGRSISKDTWAKLTIERYDKMRRAGGVVTCLTCLGLAR